ncbi:MAG TPA: LysM peptidoglycan-binding domain-containing protein [Gammaproteobacteria bacterium]|jgi:hypothetical protein
MPANNNLRQSKGFFLLAGIMLLVACAEPPPPYAVVYEPPPPQENVVVKAAVEQPRPVETIVYEPEYPETYIVQEGDTLWDISTVFLRDPWYWPEIWFKNPQIENPHLIYPGDTLAIIYVGGQRRVQLISRGEQGQLQQGQTAEGLQIVKVNPRVRTQPIDATIPTIQIDRIRHLIARPMVIDPETLNNSAYVLASLDDHLINSINDKLYVRKLDTSSGSGRYQIYRPNRPIYDPDTSELLGYEAIYVGESKLLLRGDPASVRVTNSEREILRDDRVMPIDNTAFERDFYPRPPNSEVSGRIVALLDAISQTGLYQTIAINLGQRDGLETGNILRISRIGVAIPDPAEPDPRFRVKLPDEQIGMAMIIRTFEKMSYALVMEADFPITLNDYVESP